MTVRVAVVDDYALVVAGVAKLLEPYRDRVRVVEIDANKHPDEPIDVAMYDAFAQGQAHHSDVQPLLDDSDVDHVVMYTWNFAPQLIEAARDRSMSGYLAKSLPADQLVESIERIAHGEFVLSPPPPAPGRPQNRGDWPGRSLGLSERESEVLSLLTQGFDTRRIADTMYLSQNTIRTYFKSLYRKLDVNTRSAAVLWGIDHGFRPDQYRERQPHS